MSLIIFISVVSIIFEFPASNDVAVVGGNIVNTTDPVCSDSELTVLNSKELSLSEASKYLGNALEEAQTNLKETTGSTLSALELSEITVLGSGFTIDNRTPLDFSYDIDRAAGSHVTGVVQPYSIQGASVGGYLITA